MISRKTTWNNSINDIKALKGLKSCSLQIGPTRQKENVAACLTVGVVWQIQVYVLMLAPVS